MPSESPPASPLHNADLARIAAFLKAAPRVLALTHAKPDGDALGSTLGVVRALNHLRAGSATAWYFSPFPNFMSAIVAATEVRTFEVAPGVQPALPELASGDRVLVIDTCAWMQLGPAAPLLRGKAERVCVVDHHVSGDSDVGSLRCVQTHAAAACQIAAELCSLLLNVPIEKLPSDVADALYLGLATDTGWFKHSNVTGDVMRCAGKLIDAGADAVRLYQLVEQTETPGRLKALAKALNTLQLRCEGHLATMHLSLDDLRAAGAQPGETGGFTDFGQNIPSVAVTALLTQMPPDASNPKAPNVKVSLRSKATHPSIDVNAICAKLGGGGHVRASGAKLHAASLDVAVDIIEGLVGDALRAQGVRL
jgi:phosphoesterase RecJ-like protein